MAKPWLKYAQCALVKANKMADSCASDFDTILQLCEEAVLWNPPCFNSIFCSAEVFLANSLLYRKITPDTQTNNYYNPAVHARHRVNKCMVGAHHFHMLCRLQKEVTASVCTCVAWTCNTGVPPVWPPLWGRLQLPKQYPGQYRCCVGCLQGIVWGGGETEQLQCYSVYLLYIAGHIDGMHTHMSHSMNRNRKRDSHTCTLSHVGYKFLHFHRHFGHTLKTLHNIHR